MYKLTGWLNYRVKETGLCLLFSLPFAAFTQSSSSISLQQVYDAAEVNFPFIRQQDLLKQTETLSLKNFSTALLPQLTLNAQGSYQSDVTQVSIPLPGIKIPSQSKDQYRVTADVSQLLYDGGQVRSQKNLQLLNTRVEESRVAVDIFQVKNRVTQIYFNILYQDALLQQAALAIRDVQTGLDKVRPQVANQTVLRSNQQVLEVQLLQVEQRLIEIRSVRRGLLAALSVLTNFKLSDSTKFLLPGSSTNTTASITRPEVFLFDQQSKLAEGQLQLINAKNKPRASLFLQAGYGKPALNLLSNQFDFFYITGLRLNWSLGNLYNKSREKKLVEVSSHNIDLQKEIFLLNTNAQLVQVNAEIEKFRQLVASDEAIISLRNRITESAKAQLENAVITASDYLREVNAADLARQALVTHQLQLLQAEINYQITSGKL